MSNTMTDSQSPTKPAASFPQLLEHVVGNLKITKDLSITHPDYPTLSVPSHYHGYLQQMSEAQRDRYLTHKLQSYLYGIFMDRVSTPATENDLEDSAIMVNRGDRWYETEFYRQLVRCNHGTGYSDPNWSIVSQSTAYWQVAKDGLTLKIDPQQHLIEPNIALQLGDTVAIRLPSNSIERGYYIAVGNAGSVSNWRSTREQTIFQLYFNLDAPTALKLLDFSTQRLNQLQIPFDFKLSYRAADFPRSDAAVLEFSDRDWQLLKLVVKEINCYFDRGLNSKTPFFCSQIRSGIGLAEKPFFATNEGYKNLGDRYCVYVAQAIVRSLKVAKIDRKKMLALVRDELSQQQLLSTKIYLNPNSKGIITGIS